MSNDPYFQSQGSGYDAPPLTSSPPYDQSTFNQLNESYPPFGSSEGFQNPAGFMGSAPLAQLNSALEGFSTAYGDFGANYEHSGLTDNTVQPTSSMQEYSTGLTNAPVPAGESAFADSSQYSMHYAGSSNTVMQAQSGHYRQEYTELNTRNSPLPQSNTSRARFYCTFPHCNSTKGFGRKPDLDRHVMNLHNKPRNFPCPYCKKVCNRKDNLNAHILSVHGQTGKQPPR